MSGIIEWLASIATAGLVIFGLGSQIMVNYRRGTAEGLSPTFIVLSFIVWSLWSWFGFSSGAWFMFAAQGLGALFSLILLAQIFLGWFLKKK